MVTDASPADLAFNAARVGLATDALAPGLAVALNDGPLLPARDVIAALQTASKPVRIAGRVEGGALRLRLSPVAADADAAKRFAIRTHNLGVDPLPLARPDGSASALFLVIAFDKLLRVSAATWRQFIRDFWVDGPFGWSADSPKSEWGRSLNLPSESLQDVTAVVLFGYTADNQMRSPFIPSAWEAA